MQKTIISDTSCIILLDNINELEILNKLFGIILTTKEVAEEYGKLLPEWIEIKQPKDLTQQSSFELTVDRGEASALALAVELNDCLLIIDNLRARKLAKRLGLNIIGTIGVILDAKLNGILPSIKPILNKIRKTNFRISAQLEGVLLKRAGE